MPKSQKGQKQGAATSTPSKMKATDPASLPGTSGGFVVRDGSKKGGRNRSDDRGKSDHAISDSESDTSSDTEPVTPRKTWLGSVFSSPKRQQARTTSPSAWCARDTEAYRNRYPNKRDNKSLNDNWKFYNNEIESKPRGTYIDTMHEHWFGDYSLLEEHHGYIQWLFPIREMGMNRQAQELQLHEAERICKDPKCSDRVVKSYELMLHFWGMHLEDRQKGKIVRGDNWKERFRNLNRSSHNYLRITQILKSLGELGHERLKLPFLKFVLHEAIVERTLANAERSCLHYWIHTLRDDKQRKWIQIYADNLLAESKH
ncbi:opioid growth factor receptor-like protein 1 [Patiria miniata]|uniref:C2H2-type domain-containing protein n=1 Tax=Patiria miniata TaxID=46514 RepID=A0A914B6D3_PATMI|nr:opioid growth factor receptor-like protein 1 [Patiria miniata]